MSTLLRYIIDHLLADAKPSIYLKSIKESLKDTPLEILIELESVEQEKKTPSRRKCVESCIISCRSSSYYKRVCK